MARKFSLQINQNLKHSMSKQELTDDVSALLAAVTWILPSTLLNLNSYAGLGVAFASTWGIGALFNIPGLRRAAWALGAVQLAYTAGRAPIEKALDKPLWRMDESGTTDSTGGETPANGLAAAMQAGARMTQLPNGTYAPSYDGMMDRFAPDYAASKGLEGYSDGYGSPSAAGNAPMFSTSPF